MRLAGKLNYAGNISYDALLHDIGKSVTTSLLRSKKGKYYGREDYEIIKLHAAIGYLIVKKAAQSRGLSDLGPSAVSILCHQEDWNGRGYPLGLKGEDIPLPSRIIRVLDTFFAMALDRTYSPAAPLDVVYAELKRCSGLGFDEDLLKEYHEKETEEFKASELMKRVIRNLRYQGLSLDDIEHLPEPDVSHDLHKMDAKKAGKEILKDEYFKLKLQKERIFDQSVVIMFLNYAQQNPAYINKLLKTNENHIPIL